LKISIPLEYICRYANYKRPFCNVWALEPPSPLSRHKKAPPLSLSFSSPFVSLVIYRFDCSNTGSAPVLHRHLPLNMNARMSFTSCAFVLGAPCTQGNPRPAPSNSPVPWESSSHKSAAGALLSTRGSQRQSSLFPSTTLPRLRVSSFICWVFDATTIMPRTSLPRNDLCVRCLLCSVKRLIGSRSTSSTTTSFFIRHGHTGRCHGVLLFRTDASDQRRARCWLPFFRKTGRNLSFHE